MKQNRISNSNFSIDNCVGDMECRIVWVFGDISFIWGTIEKGKPSYDKSIFSDNANQAIVMDGFPPINKIATIR